MVSRPSSFEGDLVDSFILFMFHSEDVNKSRVVLITVFYFTGYVRSGLFSERCW